MITCLYLTFEENISVFLLFRGYFCIHCTMHRRQTSYIELGHEDAKIIYFKQEC